MDLLVCFPWRRLGDPSTIPEREIKSKTKKRKRGESANRPTGKNTKRKEARKGKKTEKPPPVTLQHRREKKQREKGRNTRSGGKKKS